MLVAFSLESSHSSSFQVQSILDPQTIIAWGGVAAIALTIFVETGLFVGFVLPGDSLLIVAGILASKGVLELRLVIVAAIVAAVAGDQVGYTIGSRLGSSLVERHRRFKKYIQRAEIFFERHGGKTITLARFVPVVRTFAPSVAGAAKMSYRRFVAYNVVGGMGWVLAITLAGYLLGKIIPNLDQDLLAVIAIVVAISLLPWLIEIKRNWRGVLALISPKSKAPKIKLIQAIRPVAFLVIQLIVEAPGAGFEPAWPERTTG